MSSRSPDVNHLVANLFRHEAGKLIAMLTRLFGAGRIDIAEDIVQETLITALNHWSVGAVPDNPAAWITQVAKRKALNELKRHQTARKHYDFLLKDAGSQESQIDEIFSEKAIRDNQLRMIFTCCHPDLPLQSQIALTLKTLCGFGVNEIANSLLTTETNINKRLYRAKQKIRTSEIPFEVPDDDHLGSRLDAVCLTIYLLFNEGYNSSHPDALIRQNLCAEAIRLTQLLLDRFDNRPDIHALLALMYFHTARFKARLDDKGAIVIFEDQDRGLWDKEFIGQGLKQLQKAASGHKLSEYHLEAAIAAEHCLASSFQQTNWESIYQQYQRLFELKKNPVIKLNMAIIESKISGLEVALKKLKVLESSGQLDKYYLLPATQGVFLMEIDDFDSAKNYLMRAKSLTSSSQEIEFIDEKLRVCYQKASDKKSSS